MTTIGDRIKIIRESTKLSLREFAKEIGATHPIIIKWEDNESIPNGKYLELICKLFKIDANWVLTGEGEMILDKKYSKQQIQDLEEKVRKYQEELLDMYRKTSQTAGFVG